MTYSATKIQTPLRRLALPVNVARLPLHLLYNLAVHDPAARTDLCQCQYLMPMAEEDSQLLCFAIDRERIGDHFLAEHLCGVFY
jgi:hypothetical protein